MTQEEFNAMLQVAIAQGLPGGYYTSKFSGEETDAILSGKGMVFLGRYDTVDDVPSPIEEGHYYIGAETPYHVFTYIKGNWIDAGIMEGPKGDPFTYEDFTQEQLDDLERGAKDAQMAAETAASRAASAASDAKAYSSSALSSANRASNYANSMDGRYNSYMSDIRAEGDTQVDRVTKKGDQAVNDVTRIADEASKFADRAEAASVNTPKVLNGNWWVYNKYTGAYEDSGVSAYYTPIRGTDYWTAEDQAAIVSDVLAALPDGTEVSY